MSMENTTYTVKSGTVVTTLSGYKWRVPSGTRITQKPGFQQAVHPDGIWWVFTPDFFASVEDADGLWMSWYTYPRFDADIWWLRPTYEGQIPGSNIEFPLWMRRHEVAPLLTRLLETMTQPGVCPPNSPISTQEVARDVGGFMELPEIDPEIPSNAHVALEREVMGRQSDGTSQLLKKGPYATKIRGYTIQTGQVTSIRFEALAADEDYEDVVDGDMWKKWLTSGSLKIVRNFDTDPI